MSEADIKLTHKTPGSDCKLAARSLIDTLTPRELEVLQGIVDGGSNESIARALGVRPRTVKNHRSHMMHKIKAHSAADAVRVGLYAGLGTKF